MTEILQPDDEEFHVWESAPTDDIWAESLPPWHPYLRGPAVLDVGSGEGHVLKALVKRGYKAEGVDLTGSLATRARERGLTVTQEDALTFIRRRGHEFETFLMLDFVEHVPYATVAALFAAIPRGACLVVQTPNTNSLVGHQFYLQVPSHITPLSPMVLRGMCKRAGLDWLADGTAYGGLPWTGLRRKVAEFVLIKVLGKVTTRLLVEGANFWFVARKL
jgi:2-polyprenyl-3-methyl-5-hydroxy-6-metoxy-1,4-benzoquinol methylase